jgi:Zn-dependent peptidase ImmA (M78 family)
MRRFPPLPVDDLFDVFPVPVDIIAKCYYGMEVHRRYLPDSVGAILHKFQGRSYLYVNAAHSPERQRYSIAHELAHHRLHPLGVYMAGPGASTASERGADMIAADILMPRPEVRRLLREGVSFGEMVKRFGVSKEAMRFRLDEVTREERQREEAATPLPVERDETSGAGPPERSLNRTNAGGQWGATMGY